MIRLVSNIKFTQQSSTVYPDRKKTFEFSFVNRIEISNSWNNLTDTCNLVVPKKLYFYDETGNAFTFDGKAVIGDSSMPPLLLRGDKIEVSLGYEYPNADGSYSIETNKEFEGFISNVTPKMPLEISAQDRMWRLKQLKVPDKYYKGSEYTVQKLIRELLDLFPETKDISLVTGTATTQEIQTKIGDFATQSDTIGSVLDRLKTEFRIYSYFRNWNELRCSGIVYFPSDRRERVFDFFKNITEDKLEVKRTDDVYIGARVVSISKEELTEVNADNSKKKKTKRVEVQVGDKSGEQKTIYLPGITDEKQLKEKGEAELRKLNWAGLDGTFDCFGLPSLRHGDSAILRNELIKEYQGNYIIRSVKKIFSVSDGFRQTVEPHFSLGGYTDSQIQAGL